MRQRAALAALGDDTLNSGSGADMLTGGGGADQFLFLRGEANNDLITDFEVGVDHIDFQGYNSGTTFAKIGGQWMVTDGSLHETIRFAGKSSTLIGAEYTFH